MKDNENEFFEEDEAPQSEAQQNIESEVRENFWTFRNIIIVAFIFSMIIFGFWYYFFGAGLVQSMRESRAEQEAKANQMEVLSLDTMIIPLYSADKAVPNFAKIDVAFEIRGRQNLAAIATHKARIADVLYQYLNGLRIEDVRGYIGLYRLRRELLRRVNHSIAPAEIEAVLIKDLIIQ